MATGRQDSHRIALRPREYQRKQGGYEYRWREAIGKDENGKTLYKQHAVVADTLQELRKMEDDLKRTELAGIKPKQDVTLNEYVDRWFKIKRGLRNIDVAVARRTAIHGRTKQQAQPVWLSCFKIYREGARAPFPSMTQKLCHGTTYDTVFSV